MADDAEHATDDEHPRRVAVRVTKDAARQVRGGHPWVFDDSVVSVKPVGMTGDLAVIFDDRRKFMAIGLYDPASPIRVRVLHQGRPTPIDGSFWRTRIADAIERRGDLVGSPSTTAYRVVHGENDAMPAFVLDRYEAVLVLKLYSAAWIPFLSTIVPILDELLEPEALIVRFSRQVARGETGGYVDGSALIGSTPDAPVAFVENGLSFEADLVEGQKTGHFLDQRDNRLRARSLASGARVLDVFCCTGGFSVNAAAGGATSVLGVDVSPHALAAAEQNMRRNASVPLVAACRHEVGRGDAFGVMEDLFERGNRFDLVIVDPPSFASSQRQVAGALRSYARLAELAVGLLSPGGRVMLCSCSSRVSDTAFFEVVHEGAARGGARLVDEDHTGHAVDHPVGFVHGAYLKALIARVEPKPSGVRRERG